MLDQMKVLRPCPQGQQHSATKRQLLQKRLRNRRRRGSNDDRIKRRGFRQTQLPIGIFQTHLELLDLAHVRLGFCQQRLNALNGIDFIGQLRENGGLITAPRADFERLSRVYEQFLIRQRQMAAVLEAHGLDVLYVHVRSGQDARQLIGH